MSNPNYTAIMLVLDESSSMSDDVYADGDYRMRYEVMQEALHTMLEQQARKLAGYLTVDVGYFNTRYRMGAVDADPLLLNLAMGAGGGTEVYRGVYHLVGAFRDRIDNLPEDEKPGHVVVVVMTDGESSDSAGLSTAAGSLVTDLINNRGWDFAFLAAAEGAMSGVRELRIPRDCAIEEDGSPEGISAMVEQLGEFVSVARGGGEASFANSN